MSSFFSPCHEQILDIQVETNVDDGKRTLLNKMIKLPMINTPGKISLVYDELSKIVKVMAVAGTLDCAGDRINIRTLAGRGNLYIDLTTSK